MVTSERGIAQDQPTSLAAEKDRLPVSTEAFLPRFTSEMAIIMVIAQQSALMMARSSGNPPQTLAEQMPVRFRSIRGEKLSAAKSKESEIWKNARGGKSRRCESCGQRHSPGSPCNTSGLLRFQLFRPVSLIKKLTSKTSGL